MNKEQEVFDVQGRGNVEHMRNRKCLVYYEWEYVVDGKANRKCSVYIQGTGSDYY